MAISTNNNNSLGGSTYNYSGTQSGQGNWNTGGAPTGSGSLQYGIVGVKPQYNVAPNTAGMSPAQAAAVMAQYQTRLAAQGQRNPGAIPGGQAIPTAIPPPPLVPLRPRPRYLPPMVQPPAAYPPVPGAIPQIPPSSFIQTYPNEYNNPAGQGSGFKSLSPAPQPAPPTGSTHYKNQDFPSLQTPGTTGGGSGGGGGSGYARGGEVKRGYRPLFGGFRRGKAKAKAKSGKAREVASKGRVKKTEKQPVQKFARGGAVEKFMAKYPEFRLNG